MARCRGLCAVCCVLHFVCVWVCVCVCMCLCVGGHGLSSTLSLRDPHLFQLERLTSTKGYTAFFQDDEAIAEAYERSEALFRKPPPAPALTPKGKGVCPFVPLSLSPSLPLSLSPSVPLYLCTWVQGCMVHGAWCMVHGAWCVVRGAWCMVHGCGKGGRGGGGEAAPCTSLLPSV